jgi:Methyltransferase domain
LGAVIGVFLPAMKSRTSLILTLIKSGYEPAQIIVRLALRKALADCDRVLDVGCGSSLTMRHLGVPHPVGIEGYQPTFEEAKRRNTHDELVLGNVTDLARYFQPRQFDGCVAVDVIEHLTKADGLQLMKNMESLARKKVVLFTPSGFLPQAHTDQGDLQEHLSGWEPDEMKSYGYHVTGLLGPRSLRGDHHVLKGRPRIFWGVISLLGHWFWTRRCPDKAAAILCVKTM